MENWLPTRYLVFLACLLLTAIALAAWSRHGFGTHLVAVAGTALSLVGIADVLQRKSTLRRNYPLICHLRFFFEYVRPMLRQYVVESDNEEVPFSHVQRAVVYQRSKNALDVRPFGSELDMYAERYEWINHSMRPSAIADRDFRIAIGGWDPLESTCRHASLSIL